MRKQRTLITKTLYFGIDAQRLRDASGRVLSRIVGLTPERARVSAQHVRYDFGMNTIEGATKIRAAFTALSSFVNAQLVTELRLLPRPFAVVYQAP